MRGKLWATTALGCGVLWLLAAGAAAAQTATQAQSAGPLQSPSVAGSRPTVGTPPAPSDQPTSAAPTNSTQVQEVVVTANREAQSLSHVGIAVTAVGSEELTRENVERPQDLVGLVPSFQVTETFGGNAFYTLRGVGFSSNNASSTSPIGVYLDEAAIPYTYMSQGLLFDLDRVEVLKGPQGTLYGRATTGGLINYITAKPTRDFHYGGEVEVGNYATVDASAFVSGPINDWIRARVAVDSQNRFDGWQHSVTRDETLGERHMQAVRATVDFGNGGPWALTLSGTYWNKHADTLAPQAIQYFFAGKPVANPRAAASVFNPTTATRADWTSVNYQPQAALGIFHPAPETHSDFAVITANASYQLNENLKLVSLTDFDNLNNRDANDNAGLQTESLFQNNYGEVRSASEELRLLGDYGRFKWTLGFYYADDHAANTQVGYVTDNGTIATLRGAALLFKQLGLPTAAPYSVAQLSTSFGNFKDRGEYQTNVLAGFFNGEYRFNDLLRVSGGGRYTGDHTSFQGCTYDYMGGNVALVNTVFPVLLKAALPALTPGHCYSVNATNNGFPDVVRQKQDEDNFSWHANIDITPTPTSLYYASISRGYKSGGFPVLAASSVTQFSPVRQEELTDYEVGAKLGLFGRRVQLNTAIFYYDYTDKQIVGRVADIVFGSLQRIRNVPSSHEFGVEGDVTWRVTPDLTATLAGSYIDSHIGSFNDFTPFGATGNFDGSAFPFTPKVSGVGSLVYSRPVTPDYLVNASFTTTYQDASQSEISDNPLFKIKSHALLDATLGVAPTAGRWTATLYVKNLLDTYYWTAVGYGIDSVYRYPGMPREFGARVTYKY